MYQNHYIMFIFSSELNDVARLHMYLEERANAHGKYMLPVQNPNDAIVLKFGLRLIQMGVKEEENVLKISCWVRQVIRKCQYNYSLSWSAYTADIVLQHCKIGCRRISLASIYIT